MCILYQCHFEWGFRWFSKAVDLGLLWFTVGLVSAFPIIFKAMWFEPLQRTIFSKFFQSLSRTIQVLKLDMVYSCVFCILKLT